LGLYLENITETIVGFQDNLGHVSAYLRFYKQGNVNILDWELYQSIYVSIYNIRKKKLSNRDYY
jgi:hypothetical protein